MSGINYMQLRQDVKFPLQWDTEDYKIFVLDAESNVIFQVDSDNYDATDEESEHPFEWLIGTPLNDEKEMNFVNPRFIEYAGEIYDRHDGKRIGQVRGWGRLQYKEQAVNRQDNIVKYALKVLNNIGG